MPAAKAEQRRRAEHVDAAEPGLQLLERAYCIGLAGSTDDDADEVGERGVAERASPLELLREEAGNVVPRGVHDRARVGLERLYEHPAGGFAAAAPGELR